MWPAGSARRATFEAVSDRLVTRTRAHVTPSPSDHGFTNAAAIGLELPLSLSMVREDFGSIQSNLNAPRAIGVERPR